MPMKAIESDLASFFSTRDFADEAIIYFSTGKVAKVCGIFDDGDVPTENAVSEFISDVYVRETKFECATSDVVGLQINDKITIKNVDYYVAYPVSDGTGTTTIHLSKETL